MGHEVYLSAANIQPELTKGAVEMPVKVCIPVAYRAQTQGQAAIQAHGKSVREVIDGLISTFPGLEHKIRDDTGAIRATINIYLNREDIRFKNGHDTAVAGGDEITLLLPASGG